MKLYSLRLIWRTNFAVVKLHIDQQRQKLSRLNNTQFVSTTNNFKLKDNHKVSIKRIRWVVFLKHKESELHLTLVNFDLNCLVW